MANKYAIDADMDDQEQVNSEGFTEFQAHELSSEQRQLCEDCFDFFDKDNDKVVDRNELIMVMRAVGLNPSIKDAEKMINSVVEDGCKEITKDNFMEMMSRSWKSVKQSKLEILASFHIFDINKDGYISAEELLKTLTTMGETLTKEEADYLLKIADVNNDGKIDYKEFVNLMCQS